MPRRTAAPGRFAPMREEQLCPWFSVLLLLMIEATPAVTARRVLAEAAKEGCTETEQIQRAVTAVMEANPHWTAESTEQFVKRIKTLLKS